MRHAGGVNSHMASICPISWTKKLVFFFSFFENQLGDDSSGLPTRGSFFSKKTRSWICGTHYKENTTHNRENTSNNIPIPIKIPQKWMGGSKYMVGWPAGRPGFSKKRAARINPADPPGSPFFWKTWPAGWPANHVFGSTHPFWGYIIGIGILLNVFSLLWAVFSLLWATLKIGPPHQRGNRKIIKESL